jgi:DNA-binding beta-propeller fold protein YncE
MESLINLQGELKRGPGAVRRWLGEVASSTRFQRPYAVAWDGDDLIVADPEAGRVARIGSNGRITFSREGEITAPIGVAACPAGIVVTDSRYGTVSLLDRELRYMKTLADDLSRPTGVACGDGRIVVAETGRHRALVLDLEGGRSVLGQRGARGGEFNFPVAVALSGQTLLVGDTLNFRVQQLDASSGEFLASFGQLGDAPGEMPRIKGIAIDRAGHVWVTDGHLDRVSLYDREGNFLTSIGQTGSGPAEFSFPAGVASHPDGRVAVADSLNRRVQIFRVSGK